MITETIITLKDIELLMLSVVQTSNMVTSIMKSVQKLPEVDHVMGEQLNIWHGIISQSEPLLRSLPRAIGEIVKCNEQLYKLCQNIEPSNEIVEQMHANQRKHLGGYIIKDDYPSTAKHELHADDITQYLGNGGDYCPYCGSKLLDFREPEFSQEGGIEQTVRCFSCEAEWAEVSRIVTISARKSPTPEKIENTVSPRQMVAIKEAMLKIKEATNEESV